MTCARSWLHDCMTKHNTCSHSDTNFHPTRLLDVGDINSQTVRVEVMPTDINSGARYATLSHRWGKSKVLRLTTSTMLRLQAGIPTAELAKTFQDAIFISRQLGITRLWIDSLCIVQDSKEDWERESSQMSNVYRHAVINVAASAAPDSDAGCLPVRSRKWMDSPTIQTEWNDRMNHNFLIYDMDVWRNTLRHMPLLKRAWVVQELLLAPRVLYICDQEMLWECYGLQTSERYPHGLPSQEPMDFIEMRREHKWRAFGPKQVAASAPLNVHGNISDVETIEEIEETQVTKDTDMNNQMLKLWRGILSTYTRCSLTCPSDKLVALSGVVKLMENVLQDEYCAGLWRSNLVRGLDWYRATSSDNISTPSVTSLDDSVPYRAPLWSWASCDGALEFCVERDTREPVFDTLHCKVVTATADRTAAVVSAELRLRGSLVTLQIERLKDTDWRLFYNGRCWSSRKRVPRYNVSFDRGLPSLPCKVHCLPLSLDTSYSTRLSCLLLRPTGNKRGQFFRLGLLTIITHEKAELLSWEHPHLAVNEEWMEYEEACRNGRYIVSII
jgi:hypothetical protein